VSAAAQGESATLIAASRRKWRWIKLAGTACLLSWLALGAGIALSVSTGAMFILATLAAVTTECVVWLTALLLGVSGYQARQRIWRRLRGRADSE